MLLAGVIMIILGVLSRFFALGVLRRLSASPVREVLASFFPGTPWFRVESDLRALNLIVRATYGDLLLGMALVLIAVLS